MCGIVGIVDLKGRPVEREVIERMCEAISHRGPDDEGFYFGPSLNAGQDRESRGSGAVGLGHRRLSIIDVSPAGHQPLSNAAGTVWITFNGEIYNYQLLRAELEGLGRRFRTKTDTEVIVQAYEQWGLDCLRRLRGMFAFAVWDEPRRRLFLARDRVGKKPLFYCRVGDRFIFASELQGLLAEPSVPREVHPAAIDAYLSLGYVPAPLTAFQGVSKLPPAHYLTLDLEPSGPEIRVNRYWSLEYHPKRRLSEADAAEALREALKEAVRLRLISDVPLGAFLSGGIDSSIVVGLMAGLSDAPVKTFSIGFKESAYNELDHARRVAERWSTEHHEFVVEPDALSILPTLVRHYGEPFADSSAIPTYYVSKMTRSQVTVALNGDGGDESFAGYQRYLGNRIADKLSRIPGSRWAMQGLGSLLPDSTAPRSHLRRARRFLFVAARPMAERYGSWIGYFDAGAKQNMYCPALRARLNGHQPSDWFARLFHESLQSRELDPVEAVMAVDVESYLPYDLLVKVDITSMANGLEARSPFLDHQVMELAAQLPVNLKLRGIEAKYLLKRAFADLLPRENVERRKMGFGVPVGEWFRGPLRPLLDDALLSAQSRNRGYFHRAYVDRMVSDHVDRRVDNSFRLWNLLMLELWHREFID